MSFSQIKLPRAILFDHDGVLVASEQLHWEAWKQLLRELEISYDEQEIQAAVGRTAPLILSEILDRHRPGWTTQQYDVHELALRKNSIYLEIAKEQLFAYPGVEAGLQWLRSQKILIAVVSNAKRRELEAALRQLGLFNLFDLVVSRDDAGPPKPDPALYLFAAASLGFAPEDCIAVEDSPPGLEAALMAQVPTAAVMTNFSKEVVQSPVPGRPDLRPTWVGASIQEFFDWLKSLAASEASSLSK